MFIETSILTRNLGDIQWVWKINNEFRKTVVFLDYQKTGNITMEILLPLSSVVAAAIGGFIGTWVKLKSEKSKHFFNQKITVYLKLIESYRNVVINNSDEESRQKYIMTQEQVELIANKEVIAISKEFYNVDQKDTPKLQTRLIEAMREDLHSTGKFR